MAVARQERWPWWQHSHKGQEKSTGNKLTHDEYVEQIHKARTMYKLGTASMRDVQRATGLSLGTNTVVLCM